MKRIIKTSLAIAAATTLLFACKPKDKKTMMMGSWKGDKIENAEMDSFFAQSQHYIDTLGKNNTPEANIAIYGTANVDSIRHILQEQRDSAKTMQLNQVKNTIFNFQANDVVVISFGGTMDTSKWHMENDSTLVMEDMSSAAKGTTTRMIVRSITGAEMKLQFEEEGMKSMVTFNKVDK